MTSPRSAAFSPSDLGLGIGLGSLGIGLGSLGCRAGRPRHSWLNSGAKTGDLPENRGKITRHG